MKWNTFPHKTQTERYGGEPCFERDNMLSIMIARESENFEIIKNVYLLFSSTGIHFVRLFNTILAQILIEERRKQPQTYP